MSKFEVKEYKTAIRKASAGRGLFALEDIPAKTCVLEYFGKELTEEEKYTSNSKYLFEVNSKITIDGYFPGNKARFINFACEPNVEFDIHKNKIYVVTIKKVKAGEELSIDYGQEYYDEYIEPNGCKCVDCHS